LILIAGIKVVTTEGREIDLRKMSYTPPKSVWFNWALLGGGCKSRESGLSKKG
jgi:hypothetical protein